jgi:POT family proton-dependent oligopeptide transporter
MLAGLIIFVLGKPALNGRARPPSALSPPRNDALWHRFRRGRGIWLLVQYQDVIQGLLVVSGVSHAGLHAVRSFKLPKEPRERMYAILFLIALNPLFWGLFEQAGGSLNLYTDRFVDRGGVPTSLFQSINPIYIVLLGPIFAGLWCGWASAGWNRRPRPSSARADCRWARPSSSSCGAHRLIGVWRR